MGSGRIPECWCWWLWFWCAVVVLSDGVGTVPSTARSHVNEIPKHDDARKSNRSGTHSESTLPNGIPDTVYTVPNNAPTVPSGVHNNVSTGPTGVPKNASTVHGNVFSASTEDPKNTPRVPSGIPKNVSTTYAPTVPSVVQNNVSTDTDVNVISVQNMDALLRLKFGPDAVAQFNSSANEEGGSQPPGRRRRAVVLLCGMPECECEKESADWLNVSCAFNSAKTVELGPGSLPDKTLGLRLENLGRLIVKPKAFGNTQGILEIYLRNVNYIHVHSSAFFNISTASTYFELDGCREAKFEDYSFKSLRGGVRPTFSDCEHIIFGHSVFSRLFKMHISNVPKLDLVNGSFTLESSGGKGPEIIFQNVTFDVIPSHTFSSSIEIGFQNCRIHVLSNNSFGATEFLRVFFDNTDLATWENGVFGEGTLVHEMNLRRVRVQKFESGGGFSAVSKLTIENSVINEVQGGAMKVMAPTFQLIDNEFTHVRHHAFEIINWNNVLIQGNTFHNMSEGAFSFPLTSAYGVSYTFTFTRNFIANISVGSLFFVPSESDVNILEIDENYLGTPCSCNLQPTTASFVKSDALLALKLYTTSHCLITDWLADCFRLRTGYIPMINYTEQICGPSKEIKCEQASHRYYPEQTDLNWNIFLDHERRLVSFILLTALCGVCFIVLVVLAMWVKRKGLVGRVLSLFFHSSSLVASSSISRVNIHEYAEIQNLQNQTQIVEESDEDDLVPIDDKATQTLPEELTQDLLQSLREKLDDPENYREAREMIEHLYDLIKVEESCNTRVSATFDEGNNLYAEVRPRTQRRTRNRDVANVGTRSPSLDKLDPVHYLPRPAVVNEYAEPRDKHVSTHLYCELAGGVPDVVVPSSSSLLANRPLPDTPGSMHL